MEIYPVYLLNFIILVVIIRIKKLINNENKYHLDYLLLYFISLLIITLNFSFSILFSINTPKVLLILMWVGSKIFYLFHLKSILKKERSKISTYYIIPLFFIIGINFLNKVKTNFFNSVNHELIEYNVLGFLTTDFKGYEQLLIAYFISTFLVLLLIFYNLIKLKNHKVISQKNKNFIFDFIKYCYLPLSIVSIAVPIILGLHLFNLNLPILLILIKLLTIISLTVLVIKPSLLKRLSSIKTLDYFDNSLESIYTKINDIFNNRKCYLNPNYVTANLSVDTGERIEILRRCIKKCCNMSVPLFINSYRINYACKLINDGFLINYSIDALVEKCGFKSQENFNRVFKILKSCTPSEFEKVR